LISYLLIQAKVITPKCLHNSITLTKSSRPDWVGSVTINTASLPVIEDITGQPIPGEPSIMIRAFPSANFLAYYEA